jgi:hypothetical protein
MEGQASTPAEHHDAVAVREVVGVVGGEGDGRAVAGQAAERAHQGAGGAGVEARRGFVEEEGAGPRQELGGDADPLALAAAERADPHRGAVEEVEGRQGLLHGAVDGVGLVVRQAEAGGVAQRRLDGQVPVDDVVLGHVADQRPEAPAVLGDVEPVVADGPVRGRVDTGQGVEEGGLPGPTGTDDADDFAGFDRQRDVVEDPGSAPEHARHTGCLHVQATAPREIGRLEDGEGCGSVRDGGHGRAPLGVGT